MKTRRRAQIDAETVLMTIGPSCKEVVIEQNTFEADGVSDESKLTPARTLRPR
jgi:hypothetical protein